MRYGIWATVSGGVTGSRGAWLKSNGTVQLFDSLTEADAETRRLRDRAAAAENGRARQGIYGGAVYGYQTRQYDGVQA